MLVASGISWALGAWNTATGWSSPLNISGIKPICVKTSKAGALPQSMTARSGIRATTNRSTPESGLSRSLAGSKRQKDSGGSWPEKGQGWGSVPDACGGLQPDPDHQAARGPGCDVMKAVARGVKASKSGLWLSTKPRTSWWPAPWRRAPLLTRR